MTSETPTRPPANHPRRRRKPHPGYTRLQHGLYSSRAVISGESEVEYCDFRHQMIGSLLPSDPMEGALVEQMVQAQWKLKRLWAAQTGVHRRHEQLHPAPADRLFSYPEHVAEVASEDNAGHGTLKTLSLEETRLVNIFHKALRKLELRQESRRKRFPQPTALEAALCAEITLRPPRPAAPLNPPPIQPPASGRAQEPPACPAAPAPVPAAPPVQPWNAVRVTSDATAGGAPPVPSASTETTSRETGISRAARMETAEPPATEVEVRGIPGGETADAPPEPPGHAPLFPRRRMPKRWAKQRRDRWRRRPFSQDAKALLRSLAPDDGLDAEEARWRRLKQRRIRGGSRAEAHLPPPPR